MTSVEAKIQDFVNRSADLRSRQDQWERDHTGIYDHHSQEAIDLRKEILELAYACKNDKQIPLWVLKGIPGYEVHSAPFPTI